MSSIQTQSFNVKAHHSLYPAIDPETTLKGSASGKGRYLSCNWDVDELTQLKDQIIQDDLLVSRLRTKA